MRIGPLLYGLSILFLQLFFNPMQIKDFKFEKHLIKANGFQRVFVCIIEGKAGRFGIHMISPPHIPEPTDEIIFEAFKKQSKDFFIDVESVVSSGKLLTDLKN